MIIAGFNKTTLLDYPGLVAATVFTNGCNFRCPFCHNGNLVLGTSALYVYPEQEVLSVLEKRKNVLQGVCISGGEPTLQADLCDFITKCKEMGYRVKLDTNGYRPDVLKNLLDAGLLDYVAMDIKNTKEKYALTVGNSSLDLSKIEESVSLIMASGIDYEFRTTVVKELHSMDDMMKIGEWLAGCRHLYLQQYQERESVIRVMQSADSSKKDAFHAYSDEEMKAIADRMNEIPELSSHVYVRGVA